jgi:hypothetical protein
LESNGALEVSDAVWTPHEDSPERAPVANRQAGPGAEDAPPAIATAGSCSAGSFPFSLSWDSVQFARWSADLPRRASAGRPRPASTVRKIVAAHRLAPLDAAASRDALARQMSGGIIAGGSLRSTRITETGLAARNRRADFPASQRVARSRRPRPSSTGTTREGSAQRVPTNRDREALGSVGRAGA